MPIRISPRYTDTKLATGALIGDKVDVFEDGMNGWMLVRARALCDNQYVNARESGFAVLTIASTYFEPIESITQAKVFPAEYGVAKAYRWRRYSAGAANVDHRIRPLPYCRVRCDAYCTEAGYL